MLYKARTFVPLFKNMQFRIANLQEKYYADTIDPLCKLCMLSPKTIKNYLKNNKEN